MKVDNFTLEQFTCPAKYDLRINRGLVPLRRKPSLSFGSVVHSALAVWYRTGDIEKAFATVLLHWPEVMPSDDFRTRDYALKVLDAYRKEYPKESWKLLEGSEGPIVEQAFTIPTGYYLDCQSVNCTSALFAVDPALAICPHCSLPREPVEYGGIIDAAIDFAGTIYVLDHKTTTVLGKDDSTYYFMQYKPDNQMTGYIWGLNRLTNRRVGGAMINALGLYKSGEVKFKRHLTARNQFEIDEWLKGVVARCNDIKRAERSGEWRMETSKCMNYGQCEYHSVHVLNDPVSRQQRLEQDYVVSPWNYEDRDD